MADEVQIQTPPGGGNGFNLRLSENKALGITGPIVVPVVCLILLGVIGWMRSRDLNESMALLNTHIQKVFDRQDSHRAELHTLILSQFDQTRAQVRAQEERLNAQEKELIEMLQSNRDITGARLEEQNKLLHLQTEAMRQQHDTVREEGRKHHSVILYNQAHPPEQHLMLELPIPSERAR